MKRVFTALLFVLLPLTVLMGLGIAIFVGCGALLARWLPLSLFQASGLAIGSTLVVAAVIHILAGITRAHQIYDPDGNFEDEDDDYDPIVPEPDFSKVGRNDYCPCGSGKKFKHCCENITVK